MIEILTSGLMNTVQDLGRPGLLDQGVGCGGAMDRDALTVGNLMVGNAGEMAGLEISIFPFRLKFHQPALVAVTGADLAVRVGERPAAGWWAFSAAAGDVLELDSPRHGHRAYLAFSGGLAVEPVLGSRATDLKSSFGGLEGRGLKRGDHLSLGASNARLLTSAGFGVDPHELGREDPLTLRVMAGAEYAAFEPGSIQSFLGEGFTVSRDNNRQGMRLEGPTLALTRRLELQSHGIMPGTVQAPPSGQLVIQLAEANTCGGYPKLAHVIGADHWKLAQARPGQKLKFTLVTRAEAVEAERLARRRIDRVAHLAPLAVKTFGKAG